MKKDTDEKKEDVITIKRDYFEHLLNCLANQKFINERPPNGDALAMGEDAYKEVHRTNQDLIDKAWNHGMFLLRINDIQNDMEIKVYDKAAAIWNSNINNIQRFIDEENKNSKDESDKITNGFKWTQLVWQEIWMWIKLSTHTDSIINYDECEIKCGQVQQSDFDEIYIRRGFNQNQRKLLMDCLKEIGIGEELV